MLRTTKTAGGRLALLLGAACATTAASWAQSQLYHFDGEGSEDRFGVSVANAGDVDNDGFADLIVGATEDFNVFAFQPGYVRVYSGLTGAQLLALDNGGPVNNGERFGGDVDGVGDLNGDGKGDLIVGVPSESSLGSQSGEARVLSGADGSQLFSVKGSSVGYQAGTSVSGAGDVNQDGTPDFIVGMPGANLNGSNSGLVRVYSGVNGGMLWERPGGSTSDRLGFSVDGLGDVNGDGRDDVLVGSYFDGAYVLSGLDGSTLLHLTVASSNDFFGYSVRGIQDVTGDSIPDLMVGAIQPSVFVTGGKGYARVFDGATGAQLHHFDGAAVDDHFGSDVDLAGDYDGDGVLDFLIAADQSSTGLPGYVSVHSGASGALIATLQGGGADNLFGNSIAYLGDVNGDGAQEFAVGEPHDSSLNFIGGSVLVQTGAAASCQQPSNYCTPVPNSTGGTGSISYLGTNSVAANDLFLFAQGIPANQTGIFYYGAGTNNVQYGNGIRCVSAGIYRLPITFVGPGGTAAQPLDITNPPQASGTITAGSTWYFQFWHRDPHAGGSNTNFTDGLKVPFCP